MAVGGMPKLSSSSEVSDVHGEQSSGLLTNTRMHTRSWTRSEMAETPHLIAWWKQCGRASDHSKLCAEFNQLQSFPNDVIMLSAALEVRVQLVNHGMIFPSRATLHLPFRPAC